MILSIHRDFVFSGEMRKAKKRLYFLEDSRKRDWCSHYDRRISARETIS